MKFTVTNNNQVLWTGYDYDLNDTALYPDMDVANIKMGCLNGHFQNNQAFASEWTTCQSIINNRFSRNWALNNVDGSGPALTGPATVQGTDLYAVLHSDPYSNPTYALVFSQGSITTTDGRFTACSSSGCTASINYYPGFFQTYSQGYTTTVAQGQTAKNIYQMTYATDTQYSAGFWHVAFTQNLKNSTVITSTNQFDQGTNSSNSQTASFNIQGPAAGYSGPTAFVVFQDNLYGTFMFH
jgi:hypothetical protein